MKKLMPLLCVFTFSVSVSGQSWVQPNAKVEKLAQGMKFTEGPVWLPDEQKLIFSDIPNSMLSLVKMATFAGWSSFTSFTAHLWALQGK